MAVKLMDRRNFVARMSLGGFCIGFIQVVPRFASTAFAQSTTATLSDLYGQSVTRSLLTAKQILDGIPAGEDFILAGPIDEGSHKHEVRIGRQEMAAFRAAFAGQTRQVTIDSEDGFSLNGQRVSGPHQVDFDRQFGRVAGTDIEVPIALLQGSDPIDPDSDTQEPVEPTEPVEPVATDKPIGVVLSDGDRPDMLVEFASSENVVDPQYCVETPGAICSWKSLDRVSGQSRMIYRADSLSLAEGSIIRVRTGTNAFALDVRKRSL